ncbi:MAG: hypothetical protein HDR88_02250 [Bacteroides sp.]|nr:hypothetical protein [Bacteroides sp.]
MAKLKNIVSYYRRINIIGEEIAPLADTNKYKIMFDFIKCYLRYGADEEDYRALELYKKSSFERKKFTTAKKNYIYLYRNHSSSCDKDTFDSKIIFNSEYSDLLKRKWISTKNHSLDQINAFIDELGEVIVKEDFGMQGIGIYKLKSSDSDKRNNLMLSIRNNNHYVIEELIIQHPDMAYFNDSCVNTCRVETITDKAGKAHIVNTVLITGGKGSSISNTHSGGVMVHIEPETGVLDSKGRNPEGKLFNVHPGTGVQLLGRKIPYWNEVKELAVQLAERRPTARYIGWDISITEGGPEVIEGNLRPGHCTQSCDMVGRWPLIKKYL